MACHGEAHSWTCEYRFTTEQNEVDGMQKGADSTGKVMHVK